MFLIAIEDDLEVEDDEFFTVTLTNPRPDDVVLNPDRITITITDNDGECPVCGSVYIPNRMYSSTLLTGVCKYVHTPTK